MSNPKYIPRIPITIIIDNKEYPGSYKVERKIITVFYKNRHAATQLGGSTADSLARVILKELVDIDDSRSSV